MTTKRIAALTVGIALGCSSRGSNAGDGEGGLVTDGPGQEASGSGASGDEDDGAAGRLDAENGGSDGGVDEACKISEDPDAIDGFGPCETPPVPPDSFEPDFQWTFDGPTADDDFESSTTPLVANLTDDDGDGVITLCDSPDVLVVGGHSGRDKHIMILDGESGAMSSRFPEYVGAGTPAIGDVDGDGEPEIVTVTCPGECQPLSRGTLTVFDPDGTIVARGDMASNGCSIALADADNDGDVEILCSQDLFDHEAKLIVNADTGAAEPHANTASVFADLDGDGDQELVFANSAAHHDGSVFWTGRLAHGAWGYPQVADLDDDGKPEVLVTYQEGLAMFEHDGRPVFRNQRPNGVPADGLNWPRPATIHDFDADGKAEFATSSGEQYSVYEPDLAIKWTVDVIEISGIASGTAFDFLGDGSAEAMYGDEGKIYIFDDEGNILLEAPRTSRTLIEYPVVADVDNDNSAEIVIVSSTPGRGYPDLNPRDSSPMVQVVKDIEDRWVPARRIWNQHTYHVTNVREDGSIPQFEPPHWEHLNTFRTNAQIENGGACRPTPAG